MKCTTFLACMSPAMLLLPLSAVAQTQPAGGGDGQGNLLNPAITAFLDMGGSLSTNDDNDAYNRFNFREAELDLRAAVAPIADGVFIIAVGEEVEDPFGDVEVAMEFEVEEGYINFHTLPAGLAAKGGKFRAGFGRNNLLHTHDLPQISRPLAVQAFLGPEGLITLGGEVSWLVPNPFDEYIEWSTAVVNNDAGEEAPLLRGPDAKNPVPITHLKWFRDFGDSLSMELGSSFMYVRKSGRFDDSLVAGADLMLLWRDSEQPDHRSLLFQGEFFWSDADTPRDGADPVSKQRHGGYAFAQAQFARNWYGGVRYDHTELPNVAERRIDDSEWAVSGWLSWYYSEVLRFRVELQHLDRELAGEQDSEQIAQLGMTFYLGAHPPHPYWVNR